MLLRNYSNVAEQLNCTHFICWAFLISVLSTLNPSFYIFFWHASSSVIYCLPATQHSFLQLNTAITRLSLGGQEKPSDLQLNQLNESQSCLLLKTSNILDISTRCSYYWPVLSNFHVSSASTIDSNSMCSSVSSWRYV